MPLHRQYAFATVRLPRGGIALATDLPLHPFTLLGPDGKHVTPKLKSAALPPFVEGFFFLDERGTARFGNLPSGHYQLRLAGLGIHAESIDHLKGADEGAISLLKLLGDAGVQIALKVAPGLVGEVRLTSRADAQMGPCCGVTAVFAKVTEQPQPQGS